MPRRARDADPDLADKLLAILKRALPDADFAEVATMIRRLAGDDDLDPDDFDLTTGQRLRAMDQRPRVYAMDSAGDAFRRMNDLRAAEREVAPVVGEVLGMDSAGDVFKTALGRLGVSTAGLPGTPALAAAFRIARRQHLDGGRPMPPARNSAAIAQLCPDAARVRVL